MPRAAGGVRLAEGVEDGSVDVTVVVVSYNTRELTRRCLQSIHEQSRGFSYEIIVVDNGSVDQSPQMVASEFPAVRLVANPENRGFAGANNQAFHMARGRFVLLLNPDTEVRDNAVLECLRFLASREDAGVAGCRVMLPNGQQQSTIFRHLRLRDIVLNILLPARWLRRSPLLGSRYPGADLETVLDVEAVAGCFMLARRDVIDRVGGLDEDFFMYGEEAEWCFRIRRSGWRVLYFPGATILHHGGESTKQAPAQMTVAMAKGQVLFIQKTQGRAAAYAANLLMLLRDLPRTAAWLLFSGFPGSEAARLLRPAASRFGFHARGLLSFDFRRHS